LHFCFAPPPIHLIPPPIHLIFTKISGAAVPDAATRPHPQVAKRTSDDEFAWDVLRKVPEQYTFCKQAFADIFASAATGELSPVERVARRVPTPRAAVHGAPGGAACCSAPRARNVQTHHKEHEVTGSDRAREEEIFHGLAGAEDLITVEQMAEAARAVYPDEAWSTSNFAHFCRLKSIVVQDIRPGPLRTVTRAQRFPQ
jgi:hypothetical protein